MKRMLALLLLAASPALAQTTIVEYPDHFYVESTGVAEAGTAVAVPSPAAPERKVVAPMPAQPMPAASTAPITNYQEPPPTPAARRAALEREKERLSREYADVAGQDPAAFQSRRESLARKMRKIDSELLKVPVQFD